MLTVAQAPVGSSRIVCVDTLGHVTPGTALTLIMRGFVACGRYVNLSESNGGYQVTADELEAICAQEHHGGFAQPDPMRLGCFGIQEARGSGWDEATGRGDGRIAARHFLYDAKYPAGAMLVCDLEGRSMDRSAAIDYGNAWHMAAAAEGCEALCLYPGAGCPLSPEELFHAMTFNAYWQPGSESGPVAVRGYRMIQLTPLDQDILATGQRFDIDVAQQDRRGGTFSWAVAA